MCCEHSSKRDPKVLRLPVKKIQEEEILKLSSKGTLYILCDYYMSRQQI